MCHQHQYGNSCWLPAQSFTRKIYLDVLGTVWWRVPPGINCGWFISARKRSLQRLRFHRCLSVHEGGRGCGRHPLRQAHPPWAGTPPGQVHLPGRHPTRQVPPGQVHPVGRYPRAGTPPLPGQVHPPSRAGTPPWQTFNKRAVRILLECILV